VNTDRDHGTGDQPHCPSFQLCFLIEDGGTYARDELGKRAVYTADGFPSGARGLDKGGTGQTNGEERTRSPGLVKALMAAASKGRREPGVVTCRIVVRQPPHGRRPVASTPRQAEPLGASRRGARNLSSADHTGSIRPAEVMWGLTPGRPPDHFRATKRRVLLSEVARPRSRSEALFGGICASPLIVDVDIQGHGQKKPRGQGLLGSLGGGGGGRRDKEGLCCFGL